MVVPCIFRKTDRTGPALVPGVSDLYTLFNHFTLDKKLGTHFPT